MFFIFFELVVVQRLLEIGGNTPPDIRFDGCYKQTIENKRTQIVHIYRNHISYSCKKGVDEA
ncbi:hypothetical protein, partial [Schleiferilactobacillus harbinensis]|uniref:hypothetical protein n=1 Tax=Schleiferilactobacillus harbinensis TaxID=304207 RepID=UPI001968AB12